MLNEKNETNYRHEELDKEPGLDPLVQILSLQLLRSFETFEYFRIQLRQKADGARIPRCPTSCLVVYLGEDFVSRMPVSCCRFPLDNRQSPHKTV